VYVGFGEFWHFGLVELIHDVGPLGCLLALVVILGAGAVEHIRDAIHCYFYVGLAKAAGRDGVHCRRVEKCNKEHVSVEEHILRQVERRVDQLQCSPVQKENQDAERDHHQRQQNQVLVCFLHHAKGIDDHVRDDEEVNEVQEDHDHFEDF